MYALIYNGLWITGWDAYYENSVYITCTGIT